MNAAGVLRSRRRFVRPVLLTLFALPWIGVPLWMVIVNSFKPVGEAAELSLALPRDWTIGGNYRAVIDEGDYWKGLRNSLVVAVPTMALVILIGAAAAWAFARSRSRWLSAAYYVTTLSILIPPSIIPTIYLLRELHLDGGRLGYVLAMTGSRMGVVVFLATGFIRALPRDLEDAASIDGASHLQVFTRILLPLLRPVLFVGGIILAINVWNDFFFALFLLPGQDEATLPLTLFQVASQTAQTLRWNMVFAHVVLSSLPLIVVYVLAQRRIMSGLTEGALKG